MDWNPWIAIISALVTVPILAPLPQNSSCLNSWPTSDGGFCGSLACACAIRRPLRKSFRAKPLFSAFSKSFDKCCFSFCDCKRALKG